MWWAPCLGVTFPCMPRDINFGRQWWDYRGNVVGAIKVSKLDTQSYISVLLKEANQTSWGYSSAKEGAINSQLRHQLLSQAQTSFTPVGGLVERKWFLHETAYGKFCVMISGHCCFQMYFIFFFCRFHHHKLTGRLHPLYGREGRHLYGYRYLKWCIFIFVVNCPLMERNEHKYQSRLI